jgi:four helix bundle protein
MQRAAAAIPANLAEGHARDSTKESLHHLSFARGSLAELETFLVLAQSLAMCTAQRTASIQQRWDEVRRMLRALQLRLKSK